MDDPVKDIPLAINLCAGAKTADLQVTAFHRYFAPDASFLHPLCYVRSRPESRRRVIGVYLFYRAIIPETHFDIEYVAFDEKVPGVEGHLFVKLVQKPSLLFLTYWTGWRPAIPMHINFDLVKSCANCENGKGAKWLIKTQEDLVQPYTLLLAIPVLSIFGRLFYALCELMGLMCAWISVTIGLWRPSAHLRKR